MTVFGSPVLLLCFLVREDIVLCAFQYHVAHRRQPRAVHNGTQAYAAGQVMHRIGVPQVGVFGYALR